MPFVVTKKETFWWPVKIKLIADNDYSEGEFNALFKHLSVSQFLELINDPNKNDFETMKSILVGWSDLKLADGSEVPFDAERLVEYNDIMGFTPSVLRAYYDAVNGAARIKN
ncbi:MAG: hypothetical protein V4525_10965 [Pseudomonadota bacterium]